MTVFKIRRKSDGLFYVSEGTVQRYFNRSGRTWTKLSYVHQTLKSLTDFDFLADCEIVKFELKETKTQDVDLSQYLK
jgi:hypothetical protein